MTDTVPEDFPDNPELDHGLDGKKSLPGFGSMPFLIFIPNREEIILKWKKSYLRGDFSSWRDFRDEIHTEHILNQQLIEEAREVIHLASSIPGLVLATIYGTLNIDKNVPGISSQAPQTSVLKL